MKLTARLRDVAPDKSVLPPRSDGIYLGWGTNGPVLARRDEHLLVTGPPRSGKTTRLLAFSVLSHPGPVVVTSTKPDVLALTSWARERLGRLWLWDPSGTTTIPEGVAELRWSPVIGCGDFDEAVRRAYALCSAARPGQSVHDGHWTERAQALLAPLLHAAAVKGEDLATVLSWLHRHHLLSPIEALKKAGSVRAAELLEGIARTEWRERSGIFSTADSMLSTHRTESALRAASSPNFDPGAFAASNDTIYLCAASTSQALHAPLVVALLDQIKNAVYKKRFPPLMLFALDELAQIAPLPDLASIVAEGGSQGLVVIGCLQDLSQARARWGTAAEGFFTIFSHKVVLPGVADMATLKAISALAGEVDVPISSKSISEVLWERQATTTWSWRRQPRLPVDAIARGKPGTALLISGTRLGQVWLPPLPSNVTLAAQPWSAS
ncbi:MAG TPA: type IV secretory system conjugative DNA transfer family protein [Acidimicrobiales bacterium]|nr:type IV secretory system conjugative DNA transfer family protein [Acidimicrobiales bacterium]